MLKTIKWMPTRIYSAAPVPEVGKACTTEPLAEPAVEPEPSPLSATTTAARTTSTTGGRNDAKDEPCAGCRHTKNRWRTWRLIPYCVRYRTERNVKCLMYRSKEKANG